MKIIQKYILPFFKSLFDIDSNTDEKVVVGFFSFAMMIFMALIDQFTLNKVNFEVFITFASLTFACFGLGTIANVKALSVKSEVASDVAKSNSNKETNDSAKEIIQSNKPQ